MKSIFICLIGIDGSGKTSHSKALVKSLKRKGIDCKYVWGRWTPLLLKPFEIVLKRFYFRSKKIYTSSYDEYTKEKRRIIRNPVFALFWAYLVLLDYFFQFLFRIRLPLLFGKIIVCDRYIYDTLADLIVNFNFSSQKTRSKFTHHFLRLFLKPDLIFLLDVPEEIACKRKRDSGLLDYLTDRRKIYLKLSQVLEAMVLDNSRNFFEIQGIMTHAVESTIRNG